MISSKISFVASTLSRGLSTSAVVQRWHADKVRNRPLRDFGFRDPLFYTGSLPRLKNDSPIIRQRAVPTPQNPFAPSKALWGQNDYIDILGSDELHPIDVHYHIPEWLRGFRHSHHMQAIFRKKRIFADSAMPQALPREWTYIKKAADRYYLWQMKHMDQRRFSNYRGVRFGAVPNPYKTKYPF